MAHKLISILVFIAVYGLVATEVMHRAVAALLGVMVLLILGVIDVHMASGYVDIETIMLLLGMMTIVAVLRRSGFFSILSVRIAKLTGGSPPRILVLFSIVTAVISAFLDNVTTVLIMVPMVIELTRGMGLNPRIYVIVLAMVSNLGGTATLIGDPSNIIIGSKVGITFNQFAAYLFLPVLLSFCGAQCLDVGSYGFAPAISGNRPGTPIYPSQTTHPGSHFKRGSSFGHPGIQSQPLSE